ncbi:nitrogen regulation protein NR(II) [Pelagibaculum spongiae]|uniref:histidine kinase n=1 Tax=Pelagibaculum spongiae TaxID=2080658 RepID=A0A2V1GRM9_9GAMM|nr:nitrogen regulation protein NR(II) [Pelagibaculum spongiae]PVZ67661.1 PAS domain-containing sensor histidine kinase [Pelagibaculum spongiae]
MKLKTSELQPSNKLLDSLSTSVMMLDEQLVIRYVNAAAEALLEISARRLTGLDVLDVFASHLFTKEKLSGVFGLGHPFAERELDLELPGNRHLLVDCFVSAMLESSGEQYLLLEMQPMERHRRINREESLRSQQQATQGMLRGLAHEVKNPLGGIRGAAQLLHGELTDPEQREYTDVIVAEADRLKVLVDQMLGPRQAPNMQPLNILKVLERVAQVLKAEYPEDIDFIRDYDPSIPDLMADKGMLIQSVLNITRNAVEAIKGQAINLYLDRNELPPTENIEPIAKGEITLRTRALRQFTIGHIRHRLVCRIDITDNGPGIPEDLLENIFYPMVTGRAEGTGLGLSIAQSLISRHQGLIECESHPGCTVFTILLPLQSNRPSKTNSQAKQSPQSMNNSPCVPDKNISAAMVEQQ